MKDSDEQIGGEALTHCPLCTYNLAGLPKNHVCPECGFAYDESMRIWRAERSPFRKAYLASSVVAVGLIVTHCATVWGRGYHSVIDILYPLVWAFGLAVMPLVLRDRPWIVVGSRGVVLSFFNARSISWEWGEICTVRTTKILVEKRIGLVRTLKTPYRDLVEQDRIEFHAYLKRMVPAEKFQANNEG